VASIGKNVPIDELGFGDMESLCGAPIQSRWSSSLTLRRSRC